MTFVHHYGSFVGRYFLPAAASLHPQVSASPRSVCRLICLYDYPRFCRFKFISPLFWDVRARAYVCVSGGFSISFFNRENVLFGGGCLKCGQYGRLPTVDMVAAKSLRRRPVHPHRVFRPLTLDGCPNVSSSVCNLSA